MLQMKLNKIFLNRNTEVMRLYRDKRDGKQFISEWITPEDENYELIGEVDTTEYLRLIQMGSVKYHGAHKPVYDAFEKYWNAKVLLEETDVCDICDTRRKQGAHPLCYRDCPDPVHIYFLMGDTAKYLAAVDTALRSPRCAGTREEMIRANDWAWDMCFVIKITIADFLRGNFDAGERIELTLVERRSPLIGAPEEQWITYLDVPQDYEAWNIPRQVAQRFSDAFFFQHFKSPLSLLRESNNF